MHGGMWIYRWVRFVMGSAVICDEKLIENICVLPMKDN